MTVAALNRASDIKEYPKTDPRVKRIEKTIATYQRRPDAIIQILHNIQDIFGYLPLGLIRLVARELRIAPSKVYGVATFYHYFSLKPKGEHTCLVCTGTACYVKGAQKLIDQIGLVFGIKPGETTKDNKLGLETARCLGACGLAPAVVVDNEIVAKVEPVKLAEAVRARLDTKGAA